LSVNADGCSRLFVYEPRSGRLRPLDFPAGVAGAMRFPERKSDQLFVSFQTSKEPADVWQVDLKSKKLQRWTRSELGGLDPTRFMEPELVRYPSKDGTSIPAFIYRPAGRVEGRRPVVIIWHGGPEGQSRPYFTPLVQLMADELKTAVLLP